METVGKGGFGRWKVGAGGRQRRAREYKVKRMDPTHSRRKKRKPGEKKRRGERREKKKKK